MRSSDARIGRKEAVEKRKTPASPNKAPTATGLAKRPASEASASAAAPTEEARDEGIGWSFMHPSGRGESKPAAPAASGPACSRSRAARWPRRRWRRRRVRAGRGAEPAGEPAAQPDEPRQAGVGAARARRRLRHAATRRRPPRRRAPAARGAAEGADAEARAGARRRERRQPGGRSARLAPARGDAGGGRSPLAGRRPGAAAEGRSAMLPPPAPAPPPAARAPSARAPAARGNRAPRVPRPPPPPPYRPPVTSGTVLAVRATPSETWLTVRADDAGSCRARAAAERRVGHAGGGGDRLSVIGALTASPVEISRETAACCARCGPRRS